MDKAKTLRQKHKGKDVSLLRYKPYSSRQRKLEAHSIPPSVDSLHLHSRRAAYQIFVWRNYLIAKPDTRSPLEMAGNWVKTSQSPSNGTL